ncbi:MAG: DUF1015 family protein [Prevotellaceae bacterium]|jgi:uncharacterized protein (DUF1015 family)|nr:DUF1015 family protein [Prevotellaceae bacterium]
MISVKPFAGIRPPKELVQEVSARPYDVLTSEEAKAEAGEKSLLHITKPEIDFDPMIDEHDEKVYAKAVENFRKWQDKGWLVKDEKEYYYVYAQTMGQHTQYGLVGCCHFENYLSGEIKKHELTRREKEEDRMRHLLAQNANLEPVFIVYPAIKEMADIIGWGMADKPEYDFVSDDGVGHKLWIISDIFLKTRITRLFEEMPALYIADGHHRTAAAARVGEKKKTANPYHKGNEEYCYFLAVLFPDSQLSIMDYNRVVKDLNGFTPEQLLWRLKDLFAVEDMGEQEYRPTAPHNFSMYLEGHWYSLTAKPTTYNDADPIGGLDVTVLSSFVLDGILGIKDLRVDKRIDFVGGIRGLGELKRRVDSGEMAVAFALYPVSMKQLINIADSGSIMPPKTTWFEPKLRSGLVIHELKR